MFVFAHNFSGKLFQSLLLLTINEFSAASKPTRGVRNLNYYQKIKPQVLHHHPKEIIDMIAYFITSLKVVEKIMKFA
jgi:hypothetical protein